MTVTYHLVLFNVDRPAEPSQAKAMFIDKSEYESLKNGWMRDIQLGECLYEVQCYRAFDLTSDLFGTRHMLVIDIKKK